MIPSTDVNITREGNLAGEKIEMSFDQTALIHLQSVLTDLYSDPELACLREYSTNAWDSHVEAGNTAPIIVETPGTFNPFLKIKDFGVGLDAEGIRNVYSKYGASTKRSTNEQTGMLGLGCKAALTYSPQFTVVGVKNNIKTVVVISRDAEGRGVMEIISEDSTTESNGVEIMIPVAKSSDFRVKANRFFKFWKPGTVLLNGADPSKLFNKDFRQIADDLFITDDAYHGDFVVMGNVSYHAKAGSIGPRDTWKRKYSVVSFVPIGSLHFTPSREQLHYTPQTLAKLNDINKKLNASIIRAAQDEINLQTTGNDAMLAYKRWQSQLPSTYVLHWRGHELNSVFETTVDNKIHGYRPGVKNSTSYESVVAFDDLSRAVIIINDYTNSIVSPATKTKIKYYVENVLKQSYSGRIILAKNVPGTVFLADVQKVISWSDIAAIKVPRVGKEFKPVLWPTVGDYGYIQDADISKYKNVYWIERNRRRSYDRPDSIIDKKTDVLVSLPANRVDVFKKAYPNAQHVEQMLRAKAIAAIDKITEADYDRLSMSSSDVELLKNLDPYQVDSPEIKKAISIAKNTKYSPSYLEAQRLNKDLQTWGYKAEVIGSRKEVSVLGADRYPLLAHIRVWQLNSDFSKRHFYLYINAVYAAKKGKLR